MPEPTYADPFYFERLYARDPDPWRFATSDYERDKYAATLDALPSGRYTRAFEIGCSIGVLTRQLAGPLRRAARRRRFGHRAAPGRGALRGPALGPVRPDGPPAEWPDGSFDLIVFSEVLYYLGIDGIHAAARHTLEALAPGGSVMLVNWHGPTDGACTGDEAATMFIADCRPRSRPWCSAGPRNTGSTFSSSGAAPFRVGRVGALHPGRGHDDVAGPRAAPQLFRTAPADPAVTLAGHARLRGVPDLAPAPDRRGEPGEPGLRVAARSRRWPRVSSHAARSVRRRARRYLSAPAACSRTRRAPRDEARAASAAQWAGQRRGDQGRRIRVQGGAELVARVEHVPARIGEERQTRRRTISRGLLQQQLTCEIRRNEIGQAVRDRNPRRRIERQVLPQVAARFRPVHAAPIVPVMRDLLVEDLILPRRRPSGCQSSHAR